MSSQVCVISIYVPDLNKAINFYTKILGFQLNKQYGPKIATLVNGEIPMVLEEYEDVTYDLESRASRVVLALKTEDIYETVKYLKEKEVSLVIDEPTNCPPGKYISFRDPFGNILEYIQFENM